MLLAGLSLLILLEAFVLKRENNDYTIAGLSMIIVINGYAYWRIRQGKLMPAKIALPLASYAVLVYILILGNGMHDSALIAYGAVIVLNTFLLGAYSTQYIAVLSVVSLAIITLADIKGVGAPPALAQLTGIDDFTIGSVLILLALYIQRQFQQQTYRLLNEVETGLATQQQTNAELEAIKTNLENLVAERTSNLEETVKVMQALQQQESRRAHLYQSVSIIARRITTATAGEDSQHTLLDEIPILISDTFGYYHVGIFLTDADNRFAVLSASNSVAGQKMLAQKHMLPISTDSAVGTAIVHGEPHILNNIQNISQHLVNPLLPDTRAEAVFPLFVGENTIGALDIQSQEANAFDELAIEVLEILAEEIAIAIYTSRLLEDTRQQISELQALYRQQARESWRHIPQKLRIFGYHYQGIHLHPLDAPLERLQQIPHQITIQPDEDNNLFVVHAPIRLRNETLAILEIKANPTIAQSAIDEETILAVTERIGLALENARLYEETTRRAQREHMVAKIANALRSTNDPDTMLQTAIQELKQALGAREVRIIRQDESEL